MRAIEVAPILVRHDATPGRREPARAGPAARPTHALARTSQPRSLAFSRARGAMNHSYAREEPATDPGFRLHDEQDQEATETRRLRKRRRRDALAPLHDPRVEAVARYVKQQFERRPY